MASLVTEVLRQAHGISHAAHLVLLAITAYIEEHGAPVYPSQATIAKDSGVTERYIEACVQECEAAGYLQVERRRVAGKRPRNFYKLHLIGQMIPEARSGNKVRGSQFTETSSVEKKERKDLQEHRDRGTTIPEPQSPNPVHPSGDDGHAAARLTPGGEQFAAMLARSQVVKTDFAQTTLRGAQNPPTPPQDASTPRTRKPRGEGLYKLGKLCKRGHDHEGTGKTLRRLPSGGCLQCHLDWQEEKRREKVQEKRETRGPRRIVNLEAYRTSQGG
jgi:DNA-binding MarR family transcriptional regulator